MDRTPVPEAKLVETETGKKPEGDGWFVVNVGQAAALGFDDQQYGFIFEGGLGSFPISASTCACSARASRPRCITPSQRRKLSSCCRAKRA